MVLVASVVSALVVVGAILVIAAILSLALDADQAEQEYFDKLDAEPGLDPDKAGEMSDRVKYLVTDESIARHTRPTL